MRTLATILLLAGLVLAVSGCRTRRRPVIIVDADANPVVQENPVTE